MRKLLILTAGVGLIVTAATWNAHAQSTSPDRNLMFSPTSVQHTTNPQTVKQQPAQPKTKKQVDATKRVKSPPPARPAATTPQATQPQITVRDPLPLPTLGRVPFEDGSLGLSTSKQYSTTVFSDGRVTPGFENIQTKDPAYFGFSLSLPTHKNSIFPLPLLTPPD